MVQPWMLIPFGIMLLMIAIAPLIAGKFWESNRNKLICTALITVPTAIILVIEGMGHELLHQITTDYIPFITLLLALFVVTGGIQIKGNLSATPFINGMIMLVGAALASIMGTTGAAILLIRPLLDINKLRTKKVHTILFFIAMVANCGGILSPLGDPPLFLLYLRGAQFTWFLSLAQEWFTIVLTLLVIYMFLDSYLYGQEPREVKIADVDKHSPIRIKGRINGIWLICIMASVVFINPAHMPFLAKEETFFLFKYLREIVLVIIMILSWLTTKKNVRRRNHFDFLPIEEVAILFAGIFVTMTPALIFLNSHAQSLGLSTPMQFFFSTGFLSSFLDNSPTAVAFHTVASALGTGDYTGAIVAGIPEDLLRAIALGSVLFGSLTYIGNGPNFMVKAISEEYGIKMPNFFEYILKFSLPVLIPVFIIIALFFV